MILLFLACKQPPQAPTELSDLARYLFREFEADDAALAAGADNLLPWLEDPGAEEYALADLTEGDLAGTARPDRDPARCAGLAVFAASPRAPAAHTAYMILDDLTPVSPSAEVYDRSFEGDPGCFPDQGCGALRTANAIERSNVLFRIGFDLEKDHRWVTLSDGRDAILSRGWIPAEAHAEDGENHLLQSYELEAWLPAEDGGSLRMMAVWSEAEYAAIGEDLAASLLATGLLDAMEAQDEWLGE